jgi:hypothetical protein
LLNGALALVLHAVIARNWAYRPIANADAGGRRRIA